MRGRLTIALGLLAFGIALTALVLDRDGLRWWWRMREVKFVRRNQAKDFEGGINFKTLGDRPAVQNALKATRRFLREVPEREKTRSGGEGLVGIDGILYLTRPYPEETPSTSTISLWLDVFVCDEVGRELLIECELGNFYCSRTLWEALVREIFGSS
jgi:hypothetical protein